MRARSATGGVSRNDTLNRTPGAGHFRATTTAMRRGPPRRPIGVRSTETQGIGEVRIARLDSPPEMAGYWSYVGTEILEAENDEPTLNLEGFTMKVSDAEFRRVVRHEAGHTLGFDHEHMRSEIVKRIDRKKAFAFFDRTEGWTNEEIEEQVSCGRNSSWMPRACPVVSHVHCY